MTSIHEWIGSLRHRGLQLWLEGEDLKYRAPRGAIDTSDLADLRARKAELIAFLRAVSGSADSATRISAVPRTGNMPQSYAQQRLWFLYHLDGPGAAYNIVSQHRLSGPLDPAILEQSFRELCRRHEILRTTFSTENGVPVQIISQEVRLPFIVTPVSDAVEALRLAEEEAIHVFDLITGPLFRVRLLRCDAENHILLLTAHHIICDGWSLGLLFGELSVLYRAFRHGQESPLPEPELHYADYAQWQRVWLTAVLETQLHYWRRLKDAPPLLDLFADGPRSTELSSRGAVEPIRIEPDQARRFKLLCQASGVTVFMGMLAVLQALLARHTSQRDIVIGTQVAGRTRNEMEQVPGFFVNTLPLRIDVDVTQPFVALLEQVKQTTLDAMAHQETPFEKIVEILQPERIPGRNPLVQVMFLWQNARMDTLSLDDVQVRPFTGVSRSTAKFDLTLEMGEIGNGFEGVLEYRTDLFDSRLIRQFSAHLETFFSSIVGYPDRSLASLPTLAEQEREQLLGQGLGKQAPLPGADTIAGRFEHQVRTHPDRLAVVFRGVQLTYAELDSRSSRLADSLRGLGIGPEMPVALFLDPSIELIVAMLGVLKAGGAYLPLDTRTPKARLAVMLDDSTASVVLTVEPLHSLLPSSNAKTVFLDRELSQAESAITRASDPEHIAYIIYTSGSTGTPKGVMVSNRAVLNLTEWLGRDVFQKQAAVRTVLIASPAFDASVQQIFGCLLNGHTLYPVDMETRRDGVRLWRFFEDHAIELADCTPSLLAILCNTVPDNVNLALRCLLVGGEALSSSLVGDFYRQDSMRHISLINVYGPTECCVDSTSFPVPDKAEGRTVMSIGGGIFNSEIYILDRHGHPTPEAVAGEIYIAGAGLGRGYWRRPALTASVFVPHPFRAGERLYRTGDRGYWNANGRIEFLGRNDDQVKIRGHRIQLGDVETHLALHPSIRHAVVIARKVSATHKELVAYLAGDSSLTADELRRFVGNSLPEYMIPAHFVLLDNLPLNSSGKVDRKLLPEPDENRALRRDSEFIAPRNSAESALAAVWEAVLGRKLIGIRDHYIALGGDSIKALQISARLREAGFKLELSDLFLHSTIEALAPHLQVLKNSSSQEEATGEVPLTPVQLRFLHEFEGKRHYFNQSVLLSSSERLQEEPLRRALDSIVQHHDMLHAKFSRRDDNWVQRVDPSGSAAFDVVDLGDLSLAELTQHASAIQSSFVLDAGPLFRAVLYRTAVGDRLFLCAHHLIIDAVSWRILVENLEAAYRFARTGSAIHLPMRTTPFRGWAKRLLTLAESGELASEVSPPVAINPVLPLDQDGPVCLVRECMTHSLNLSRTLTAGVLRECHEAYNTEVNDILLTALARALRRFSGKTSSRIWLEGHGREPLFPNVDVSRTVGWFTAIYPVILDLGPTEEIDRNIKLVKETLRAIPRKGIAYGLLRYLAPPDVRRRFSEESSGIVFNYLGQFEAAKGPSLFTHALEDCGPMADVDATFSHDIEINALANDDCLEFHISYNPKRFYSDTIASLGSRYVEELDALVKYANSRQQRELTPSDVDYSGFNLDEMESFLNNLQEER